MDSNLKEFIEEGGEVDLLHSEELYMDFAKAYAYSLYKNVHVPRLQLYWEEALIQLLKIICKKDYEPLKEDILALQLLYEYTKVHMITYESAAKYIRVIEEIRGRFKEDSNLAIEGAEELHLQYDLFLCNLLLIKMEMED